MIDNVILLNTSQELFKLLQETEKYKKYILGTSHDDAALKSDSITKDGNLTLFGTELFQVWLESVKVKNPEKAAFIAFTRNIGIPVLNRDLGPDGLSWFGKEVYNIWLEALK